MNRSHGINDSTVLKTLIRPRGAKFISGNVMIIGKDGRRSQIYQFATGLFIAIVTEGMMRNMMDYENHIQSSQFFRGTEYRLPSAISCISEWGILN